MEESQALEQTSAMRAPGGKTMNSDEQHREPQAHRRLTRSPHGMIAGVCAGLSDCLGINLIFARFVFVVLGLANGIGVVLYLILILVIPARTSAENSGAALTCSPQSSRKTVFAYIAGGASICAALLAFASDVSSIAENFNKLLNMLRGGSSPSFYSERDSREGAAPVIQPTPARSPYMPQEVNAIRGSAKVTWRTGDVTYEGDIRMTGTLGTASVVYRHPESMSMVNVHQKMSFTHDGQGLFLVGSGPSVIDYTPDTFSLVMNRSGYLEIDKACDNLRGCVYVDSAYGQLQAAF